MAVVGSNVKIGGFTFKWMIKNFSCAERNFKRLTSPKVVVQVLDDTEWFLKFLVGGMDDNEMALTLSRSEKDEGPFSIYIDVKMFIQKNDGSLIFAEENNVCVSKSGSISPLKTTRKVIFGKGEYLLVGDTLTVGCQIFKYSCRNIFCMEYIACTEIDAKRYDLRYPIHLPLGMGHHFSSTIPVPSPSIEFPSFNVMFTSANLFGNSMVDISITMAKMNIKIFATCHLSLEDLKGNVKYQFQGEHWFRPNVDSQPWFFHRQISLSELSLGAQSNPILIMTFKLTVSDTTQISFVKNVNCSLSPREIVSRYFQDYDLKLCVPESILALYQNEKHSDFTVRVRGDEFHVHKAILESVSPVFGVMFDVDMSEKNTSVLVIEDMDTDTVRKMLQFVYTGNLENLTWEDALELYSAADKYQISHLKQYCSRFLQLNLSNENIWDLLQYPSLHQDQMMVHAFLSYIRDDRKAILHSIEWENIMKNHTTFACEIMHKIILNLDST